APPHPPPNRRAVLLDAGIRMWGVPRVFATAVGLALVANADPKAEVISYVATDAGGVESSDITRKSGLVAHLEKLRTSPHPGRAQRPRSRVAASSRDGAGRAGLLHAPAGAAALAVRVGAAGHLVRPALGRDRHLPRATAALERPRSRGAASRVKPSPRPRRW